MESLLIILAGLFVVTFIVLWFWSIIWGYKDAIDRGKNGFAVATLIALFAWPFGLLFWTIIRPENIKIKEQSAETKKNLSEPNKYISDFKEIPFLLKLFLLVSLYSIIATLFDFVRMKPVTFEYFNSEFLKNYPFIWYLYSLLFNIATVVVYFKRSYSVLKKYLYVSVGVLVISLLNSIFSVIKLPAEQRMTTTLVYSFTYILGGLIILYQLKQKQYFNKI